MAKIRVHEIARRLEISVKEVMDKLKELSVDVKAHSSTVDEEVINQLKAAMGKPGKPASKKSTGSTEQKVARKVEKSGAESKRPVHIKKKPVVAAGPVRAATGPKKAKPAADSDAKKITKKEAATTRQKPKAAYKPAEDDVKEERELRKKDKSKREQEEEKKKEQTVDKTKESTEEKIDRFPMRLRSKISAAGKRSKMFSVPEESYFADKDDELDDLDQSDKARSFPTAADVIREQELRPRMLKVKKVKRRKIVTPPEKPVKTAAQRKKSTDLPTADRDKIVTLSEGVTIKELAEKLGLRVKDVIKRLMDKGYFLNINQVLEKELAVQFAEELGYIAEVVSFEDELTVFEEEKYEPEYVHRAPVVTVMGHVDHGKTSLLDVIRKSNVVDKEYGGITQHIGAYTVDINDKKVIFLDTPGHEAFTKMRARGAKVTDIVVLVIAADDGVKQQTIEAIDHAKAADVPIIVAINKVDKPEANVDKVKQQLSELGLTTEDWGGKTVMCEVSAKKKTGIDNLLDMILLVAEMQDLKADIYKKGRGYIIEAKMDPGRGPVATLLLLDGILKVGDLFIAGAISGRVRALITDRGEKVEEMKATAPVEVLGIPELPMAGDTFQVIGDEVKARRIQAYRQNQQREKSLAVSLDDRVTLENLFDKISQGEIKELNIIIKADVQGSAEVLQTALTELSTGEVRIRIIRVSAGSVTESDVLLAAASNAIIIAFNTRPRPEIMKLAKKENVDIRLHTVIYEVTNEIKEAMEHKLEPKYEEVSKGRIEVRDTFHLPRGKIIAGSFVTDGSISRKDMIRLLRDDVVIFTGRIASLKRFKEDATEVKKNFECGIMLDNFNDIKIGDVIEVFEVKEVNSKF